jgi:large subunit ribosomal protein L15
MTAKLQKTVAKGKKRVGRGYGSGKGGHTVGRGQKGQKSRSHIGVLFEGIKVKKSLIKRIPLRRGKGKFKSRSKPLVVKLSYLNILPSGTKVSVESLVKHGIVKQDDASKFGVKILGGGKLEKKLTIALPISKSAAKNVEKAGGKVIKEKE